MLKESITAFKINIDGRELGEGSVPVSVIGAASDLGAIDNVYFGTNAKGAGDLVRNGATLTASFRVDTVIYSQRRIMLSLQRVDSPCTVALNGTTVAECDGRSVEHLVDVKKYLKIGDNTLTVVFSPEICNTDSPVERLSRMCIGGCELVAFNDDIITGVGVTEEMHDGFVRLTVSVSTLENTAAVRSVATIVSPGGRIYYCGISGGHGSIDITEPNLWWPSTYGVQNLYKLSVNLYRDEEIVDSVDMRLGLANISLLPYDGDGMPAVTVNGVPIFTRGAAYVSDDILLPYIDATRVKKNLTLLKEMGANTVVIRDIGALPGDHFFKTCDELGLLAWLELRRADLDRQRCEIERTLLGLAHHASLCLCVCECEETAALVNEIIPSLNTVVVPKIEDLFIKSRESVPERRTLLAAAPTCEMNIFSDELQYHTTLDDNISLIDSKDFRFPHGIHDLCAVTAYTECVSLRDMIEWKRRERKSDLSIILPRFNDPWPTVSSSVVDYYGRCKPQYYLLRRLFAPVTISASAEGTRVTFTVSCELKKEYSGKFSFEVITNKGEVLFRDEYKVTVSEREAMDVLTIDLAEIIKDRLDECFVSYSVTESFLTTSKGILLFTSPKKFKFLKPTFSVEVSGSGTEFSLSVSSDVPAAKVNFDFDGTEVTFDDNFIFIDDSSPRTVGFRTQSTTAIELLRREISVRSLYDIGRNN